MPRNRMPELAVWLAAGALVVLAVGEWNAAAGQCAHERSEHFAVDGSTSDEFGSAVAVWGNVALVGAWRDSAAGSLSGSAYVFRFDGLSWVQEQKIVPADVQALDFFGWAVDVEGDLAVIGNISDDDAGEDAGSAYVFRHNGAAWVQEAKLMASDGAAGDHFGVSVGVSGDTIVVGADLDGDNGTWSGAAYVFERQSGQWIQQQKLLPQPAWSYDHFGASVDVDGDRIVVGAYGGPSQSFRGTAYVFRRTSFGWQQEASMTGSQSVAGDFFASAVAIRGARVLCGARWADIGAIQDTGEAYVFRFIGSSWTEEQRLTEANPEWGDGFAYAVAMDDGLALVGVHNRDEVGFRSGEAVLFRHDGFAWQREPRLIPSDAAAEDMFGLSVALSGSVAVIGTPKDDERASDAGSFYIFDVSDCMPVLAGDIDGDGDVDEADRVHFIGVLLGTNLDPEHVARSDLNGDGLRDGADVAAFVALLINE